MSDPSTSSVRVLVAGEARGRVLRCREPLSLWGGLDPKSGRIIDRRHPRCGERVAGRVWVLPRGRGSSSASSVLLEAVRRGTAPAAILLREPDGILALGGVVAREVYGRTPPIVVVPPELWEALTEDEEVVVADGVVESSGRVASPARGPDERTPDR